MIFDKLLEFADAVDAAAGTGTANFGNNTDITIARNIGNSDIYVYMAVEEDVVTAAAAGTYQMQLVSDSQTPIRTDENQKVHFVSPQFVTNVAATTQLKKGTIISAFNIPLETAINEYQRYLGIQAIVGGNAVTGGKINAFMTLDVAAWKAYADAQN